MTNVCRSDVAFDMQAQTRDEPWPLQVHIRRERLTAPQAGRVFERAIGGLLTLFRSCSRAEITLEHYSPFREARVRERAYLASIST
jgi:hypothetical protein